MGWLYLDDGFLDHPKIIGLTDRELRVWMGVLLYCARYRTRGKVPAGARTALGLTRRTLARFRELGLLDERDGELEVHDFNVYNGQTIADRVAAYLEKNPNSSANEIARNVGGRRELILAEVAKLRSSRRTPAGSPPVPPDTKSGSDSGAIGTREPGSRIGIHARAPSPYPATTTAAGGEQGGTTPHPEPAAAAADVDELVTRLAELGWGDHELEAAKREPDRARAWLDVAEREATESIGGYAWTGFAGGAWPAERRHEPSPEERLLAQLERWVISHEATAYDEQAVRDELAIRARKARAQLSDADRDVLLDQWAEAKRQAAAGLDSPPTIERKEPTSTQNAAA